MQRERHHRWLNPVRLAESLVQHGEAVVGVEMYTAHVSGKIDLEGQQRQALYLQALRTLEPQLRLHVGKFAIKERWVKPTGYPGARPEGYSWNEPLPELVEAWVAQEKESDVKLAVHLLHHGYQDEFDRAYVVSNDSDLTEAVRLVKEELCKEVVLVPPVPERGGQSAPLAGKLREAASVVTHIRSHHLAECQFPQNVVKENGRHVTRPREWDDSS
ncbi:NYN domain-containing protein [Jannaschia marina]|uniref:NYN domain-containing protein n=1 Tax=Jannaschia marina TaxID=2741674 RepID=UPI0015CB927E|nr:NYN domain-containing protein [Jannaschia marina]